MSSESDHSERVSRPDTETAAVHGPDLVDATPGERPRDRGTDGHPVAGMWARVGSLETEVELLEAERELLRNRVRALEADIAELEDEVAALEGTVETEKQRRQQVIDRYEGIIAERDAASREPGSASKPSTAGTESERVRLFPAILSSMETVYSRMKHLVPNG
jgi:hypothetical protein